MVRDSAGLRWVVLVGETKLSAEISECATPGRASISAKLCLSFIILYLRWVSRLGKVRHFLFSNLRERAVCEPPLTRAGGVKRDLCVLDVTRNRLERIVAELQFCRRQRSASPPLRRRWAARFCPACRVGGWSRGDALCRLRILRVSSLGPVADDRPDLRSLREPYHSTGRGLM